MIVMMAAVIIMMMFPETIGKKWTRSDKSGHNGTKEDTIGKK